MKKIRLVTACLGVGFLSFVPSSMGKTPYPGASVISTGPVPLQKEARSLAPSLPRIEDDKGRVYNEGCLDNGEASLIVCTYGGGSRSVVLFGDSHAMHYSPALIQLARGRDWNLHVLVRASCGWGMISQDEACNTWREQALRYIEDLDSDLILLGASVQYYYKNPDMPYLVAAGEETIRRLQPLGSKMIVLRDGSAVVRYRKRGSVRRCLQKNMQSLLRCSWSPGRREGHSYDWEAALRTKTPWIDLESYICRPSLCPLVIGSMIVNRDSNHYSATFAKTLAPWLGRKISTLTGF